MSERNKGAMRKAKSKPQPLSAERYLRELAALQKLLKDGTLRSREYNTRYEILLGRLRNGTL